MNEPKSHIYEFGDFRLDPVKRQLVKGNDASLPLTPKVFDTLLYLVRHSGKIVEKDELMREIWANTIVEENNLSQNISILRRILGEKPGEGRFIATVPGRGFRFIPEVREIRGDEQDRGEHGAKNPARGTAPGDNFQIPKTSTTLRSVHRFRFAIFAVLAGAIAAGSFAIYLWRAGIDPAASAPLKTIAILPLSRSSQRIVTRLWK